MRRWTNLPPVYQISLNVQNIYFTESANMEFKNPPKAKESLKVTGRLTYFIDTCKVLTRALGY